MKLKKDRKFVEESKKKYRGVIFHDIEEWYKIWRKTDLLLKNWLNWRILEIFTRKVESVKIGTFIRSFCPK